jgi:hypothetical protein
MTSNLCVLHETDSLGYAVEFAKKVWRATRCDLYYREVIGLDGVSNYYQIFGPSQLHPNFYEPPSLATSRSDVENDLPPADLAIIGPCNDCNGSGDSGDGACNACGGDGFVLGD